MKFEKVDYGKKLRDYLNSDIDQMYKNMLLNLFPELGESEDESIKNWCISHFMECFRVSKDNAEYQEYLNNKVIPWLEKQGETFTKKDVDDAYLKGVRDAKHELEKQGEQKPDETEKGTNGNERKIPNSAWSEEDEKIIKTMCKEGDLKPSEKVWLKSLKDRVLPQPKQEWNGENERIIDNLVSQLGNLYARKLIKEETKDKYVDWLKSLRPQSTWKPSDEQMQALSNAGNSFRPFEEGHKVLWSLYNDLKKLI